VTGRQVMLFGTPSAMASDPVRLARLAWPG
jgi:hypothetical protein